MQTVAKGALTEPGDGIAKNGTDQDGQRERTQAELFERVHLAQHIGGCANAGNQPDPRQARFNVDHASVP